MESCLYEGTVHHERLTPVSHRFHYRLYLAYLDLAEIPGLVRAGVVSASRFAPASFARRDHLGDSKQSLETSVRELIRQKTALETQGPIRVLTLLRSFGYHFSPLTMYYCFASDGETIEAVVAMVQNTPWLQRHAYILWEGNRSDESEPGSYRHAKDFHVSPFMDMDLEYRWRLSSPAENLTIAIENASNDRVLFRAGMQLQRSPLSRASLQTMQFRHPFLTTRITASIYYQAFLLWRKKCPSYSHPKHRRPSPSQSPPGKPSGLESSKISVGAR